MALTPVPNTTTFTFQDVTTAVYGDTASGRNLSSSFTDSLYIGSMPNATNSDGTRNNQLNFQNYTPINTLTTNLVALYNFENTSTTSVGSANGTDTNVTYSTSIVKLGTYSASYNGTNAYTQMAWSISTFPFSFGFWVYIPATTGTLSLGDGLNATTVYRGITITILQTGVVALSYCNAASAGSTGRYTWQTAASTFTTFGAWTYINITCSTGVTTAPILTINNVAATMTYSSGTASSLVFTSSNMYVDITSKSGTSVYYQSYVDQLAVWSKILSLTEKTALYNGGNGFNSTFW